MGAGCRWTRQPRRFYVDVCRGDETRKYGKDRECLKRISAPLSGALSLVESGFSEIHCNPKSLHQFDRQRVICNPTWTLPSLPSTDSGGLPTAVTGPKRFSLIHSGQGT